MSKAELNPAPPPLGWKLVLGLAPAVLLWAVLVSWLAWALYARTQWWKEADAANLREWLDESRVFRKSLPELIREYVAARRPGANPGDAVAKEDEIREQLAALAEPTRVYTDQMLLLFPVIYKLEVRFPDSSLPPIKWESPVQRPGLESQVHRLDDPVVDNDTTIAVIHCVYRLHAANRGPKDEEDRAKAQWVIGGLVVTAGIVALAWVYAFLMRERRRELRQLRVQQDKEHAEKLLLENQLRIHEAEHAREEAERSALELKSQLYASIGIMAGSYAHNIKNLLVRPNDLLARCLEADGMSGPQESMLKEVRQTLGTVTERLQQILRTVRRDPNRTEMTRLDLNALVKDTHRTWEDMAKDKWKLLLRIETSSEPLWVQGDHSHLQQAIENLLFNSRDATFEMRNHLRENAHADPTLDSEARKQAVLTVAAWKGEVRMCTRLENGEAVLEVRDNGIGMSEEVRQRCTHTHFSTKRDNALYEGYSAGMGLGLSFVAMVLEHHRAKLEVESEPLKGASFRMRFPG
jgi:signal transduction histidine kinase